MSAKKMLFLGFVVVLLIAIPLSVFMVQKQQETRSRAAPLTTISFSPVTTTATVGGTLKFDIMLNPGPNQVSFVKIVVNYDPAKLAQAQIKENASVFPSVLENPAPDEANTPATATMSLSVGADPAKIITGSTAIKIASITFKPKNSTDPSTPTLVSFTSGTQALSIGSADATGENVIQQSSLIPASVTILASSAPLGTPVPSPSDGASKNTVPVCSALNPDRATTGKAPFSITFTANGTDSDGTIQKATFNFGDGAIKDVAQGGSLGTNSVNVQIAHTYNNAGSFKTTATLTDDKGGVSDPTACSQNITVTSSETGGGPIVPTPSVTGNIPITTPTFQPSPTPDSTSVIVKVPEVTVPPTKGGVNLPPTGPADIFFKWGGAAAAVSIIGGLLFFLL